MVPEREMEMTVDSGHSDGFGPERMFRQKKGRADSPFPQEPQCYEEQEIL